VYLQGSFALGDADEHSDVDVVAVTKDELNDAQLSRAHVQPAYAHHQDRNGHHLVVVPAVGRPSIVTLIDVLEIDLG
jgi:hypothetical protein